eukprot:TRINITY_DN19277_c0_g1_i1.p1 TRINITY_DN19277_c0_g1~~TRINITY_DN19277_c0_g1_i1.p1  ORF type:complete len:500 (+),score=97.62 TRINITY_DN19277_c0_g1_i1:51-1502(+)
MPLAPHGDARRRQRGKGGQQKQAEAEEGLLRRPTMRQLLDGRMGAISCCSSQTRWTPPAPGSRRPSAVQSDIWSRQMTPPDAAIPGRRSQASSRYASTGTHKVSRAPSAVSGKPIDLTTPQLDPTMAPPFRPGLDSADYTVPSSVTAVAVPRAASQLRGCHAPRALQHSAVQRPLAAKGQDSHSRAARQRVKGRSPQPTPQRRPAAQPAQSPQPTPQRPRHLPQARSQHSRSPHPTPQRPRSTAESAPRTRSPQRPQPAPQRSRSPQLSRTAHPTPQRPRRSPSAPSQLRGVPPLRSTPLRRDAAAGTPTVPATARTACSTTPRTARSTEPRTGRAHSARLDRTPAQPGRMPAQPGRLTAAVQAALAEYRPQRRTATQRSPATRQSLRRSCSAPQPQRTSSPARPRSFSPPPPRSVSPPRFFVGDLPRRAPLFNRPNWSPPPCITSIQTESRELSRVQQRPCSPPRPATPRGKYDEPAAEHLY